MKWDLFCKPNFNQNNIVYFVKIAVMSKCLMLMETEQKTISILTFWEAGSSLYLEKHLIVSLNSGCHLTELSSFEKQMYVLNF